MAKTNPIGVRFDKEMLDDLKKEDIAKSAQKALNFYEAFYAGNKIKVEDKKIRESGTKEFEPLPIIEPKNNGTKKAMPENLSKSEMFKWLKENK